MHRPELRFARIAALMADPTRARILAFLLSGEYRTAGELARNAGVTPQAASTQLAQLQEGGLLALRRQGRHKYYALADADIAHALEALALVAERDDISKRWRRPDFRPLKYARRCYGHLAGELGVAHFGMLLRHGFLSTIEDGFGLTETGEQWVVHELGIALPATQGRQAYRCMDWSERKDHLAGPLAKALLDCYLERRWLTADKSSRSIKVTPEGERLLVMRFGL